MNKEELERALQYTKKKHEYDKLNTFDTDISMLCFDTLNVLDNCIEIPNGATNGDVIKALFPSERDEYFVNITPMHLMYDGLDFVKEFRKKWWNAPYESRVN